MSISEPNGCCNGGPWLSLFLVHCRFESQKVRDRLYEYDHTNYLQGHYIRSVLVGDQQKVTEEDAYGDSRLLRGYADRLLCAVLDHSLERAAEQVTVYGFFQSDDSLHAN